MKSTEITTMRIYINSEVQQLALQFAAQQATPQKGKQVYLNTLAVQAVYNYLQIIGIEPDINQGNWRNPGLRAVFDTADLVIPEIGTIECRPILPNETSCHLPVELTENLLGYVAVQFSENLDAVEILGFTPVTKTESSKILHLSQLQPIENLLDHLFHQKVPVNSSSVLTHPYQEILQYILSSFDSSWETIESVFGANTQNLANAWRSNNQLQANEQETAGKGFIRTKLFDIGLPECQQIALIIAFIPSSEPEEVDILIEVRPIQNNTQVKMVLPPELQLTVLDKDGTIVLHAQTVEHDNKIEFEFSVKLEENFSIKLSLADFNYIKTFELKLNQ